jgi:hypothetical protein
MQTRNCIVGSVLSIMLLVVPPCAADEPAKGTEDSAARLDEMKGLVKSFLAEAPMGRSFPLRPEPLHRWNDPTRASSDAALWAFGPTGRPLAAITTELYLDQQDVPSWSFEFISLATQPIKVEGGEAFDRAWGDLPPPRPDGTILWEPREPGIAFLDIPKAQSPAKTEVVRLRQIKEIAGRFEAREFYPPTTRTTYNMRLLPRQIARYADHESNIVDGAIFLFVHGTNPEAMLLIEAQGRDTASLTWRFAVARLSRAEVEVTLDRKVVWSRPLAERPTAAESYFLARKTR